MDEEVRKSARNRRLKFLNCLYGLSELDPDIPVTRKVRNFSVALESFLKHHYIIFALRLGIPAERNLF